MEKLVYSCSRFRVITQDSAFHYHTIALVMPNNVLGEVDSWWAIVEKYPGEEKAVCGHYRTIDKYREMYLDGGE